MRETANLIVFYCFVAIIAVSSILAVTSRRMLRAATFLFIVLISTATLYIMLNYHFLAVVQLSVYAGGILILFIFAILLTSSKEDKTEPDDKRRILAGMTTGVAGLIITIWVIVKHKFLDFDNPTLTGDTEINMKHIGHVLMGTGKYQYILTFEALSILLLACIIGGILIARKR